MLRKAEHAKPTEGFSAIFDTIACGDGFFVAVRSLLLSQSDSLRWAPIWFWGRIKSVVTTRFLYPAGHWPALFLCDRGDILHRHALTGVLTVTVISGERTDGQLDIAYEAGIDDPAAAIRPERISPAIFDYG